jgi:hypothetical protein
MGGELQNKEKKGFFPPQEVDFRSGEHKAKLVKYKIYEPIHDTKHI